MLTKQELLLVPFSPLFPGVSPQLFQPQPLSGQASQNQKLDLGEVRGCEAGMTAFMPIPSAGPGFSLHGLCLCLTSVPRGPDAPVSL